MPTTVEDRDDLIDRARQMTRSGSRRILGIAGQPGAGKSALATLLAERLGPDLTRLVALDAFHLSNAELARLGRADRKGAPDTFDLDGYVVALRRLRHPRESVVYAPVFDRSLEESIAAGVAVPADVPLVITEGNYLLLPNQGWQRVRPLLDGCWYVAAGDAVRLARLEMRHAEFGKPADEARRWARGPDQRNAELVAATRQRADLVVNGEGLG